LKKFNELGRWREKIDDHIEKARCEGESAPGFFYFKCLKENQTGWTGLAGWNKKI
jgi:hypothetical protein